MSDVDSDILQALNARAEVMIAALGYPALWSQKGGDKPAGEHVTVQLLPNDNVPMGLSDQVMDRKGFFIITLVSPLGVYEIVTRKKAGAISGYFLRGAQLTVNTTTTTVLKVDIKKGRQELDRFETPIWIKYRSIT